MKNLKEIILHRDLYLISLAFFISIWHSGHCSRQLFLQVNPGCNESICERSTNKTTYINLVYVKAVGEKDIVHYLWSTIGVPSMLMAFTSLDSELQIDWKRLTDDTYTDSSIAFTKPPTYFYSLTLTKLWQFRDENDTARLSPDSNETFPIAFEEMVWNDISKSVTNDSTHCTANFVTMKNESVWMKEDGALSLGVDIYGDDGRNDILPRLQHTANCTQLHFILDQFNPQFKESRYGVEFLIATSSPNDTDVKVTVDKTIDDEYTPGVFKTAHLVSESGGFMYWKPVVYTSPNLVITNSTDVMPYDVATSNLSSVPYSIARAFLGHNATEARLFNVNVTFGTAKDEFYEKTLYQEWTVMVGVGNIPADTVSVLVIVVIAAGLGLPLLVMMLGGVYLLIDKFRKQKDDLLLSQDDR